MRTRSTPLTKRTKTTTADAMMRTGVAGLALLLAACGAGEDMNQAADDAAGIEQGERSDARLEDPLPVENPPPDPAAPDAAPGNDAVPDPYPIAEPEPEQDVADAVAVAETYFRLLGEGDYRAAYNLWRDEGQATGMSARQFADSFARYSRYSGVIGEPGRVDAGAGQRHIEIPVTVTGRLRDGNKPVRMQGELILHRTAAIEGTLQVDRPWRIRDTTFDPQPPEAADPAPAQPNRIRAEYRCDDDSRYNANFDNDANTVELATGRRRLAVLDQQRSGSGIAYEGGGYALRGQGTEAYITFPTGNRKRCTTDP